jgi:hypothetical protein
MALSFIINDNVMTPHKKSVATLIAALAIGSYALASGQTLSIAVKSGDSLPSLNQTNTQLLSFGFPVCNEMDGLAFCGRIRQTNYFTNTVFITNTTVSRIVTNIAYITKSYRVNGQIYTYTNTVPQYGRVTNTTVISTNRVTKTCTTWSGIWADDASGNRNLVIATGNAAPGTSGTFFSFQDPVYNNSNAVAFIGTVSADGTTKSDGVWTTQAFGNSQTLTAVALIHSDAPGTSGKFTKFNQIALPDQGGVLICGEADGVEGIWAQDVTGALKLVIKEKGTISVNGSNKVVSSFSFLDSDYESTEGQTRNFNQDTGNLFFKVFFKDGQDAIVKVTFP